MTQKVNLVYFSATGTTARVLNAIGAGLGGDIREYDITHAYSRRQGIEFGAEDLVVVGVPVYGGRVPDFLTEYLTRVRGTQTPAALVVVYGNRDYDDALLELKDIMEAAGFIGIAAGAFIGEHSYTRLVATGRPDQQDLQVARDFGSRVVKILANAKDTGRWPPLSVKGNFPYKERGAKHDAIPHISPDCIECGMCAESCPMQAISWTDFHDIDGAKCIKCCRCVKVCPVQAVSLEDERVERVRQMLIKNHSQVRREPEMFY